MNEKQKEFLKIKDWFIEYDNQVKQYERCLRMGIEFDKDIQELDKQAQENATKLKTLWNEIQSLNEH